MRLAAVAEQEVRARPGVHRAFYGAVGRSPRLRRLAGQVKNRVRSSQGGHSHIREPDDQPLVVTRREAATAARIGTAL